MGTYGRGFTLDDPNVNGIYAPAGAGIVAGPYTMQAGIWGFNEVCLVGYFYVWLPYIQLA